MSAMMQSVYGGGWAAGGWAPMAPPQLMAQQRAATAPKSVRSASPASSLGSSPGNGNGFLTGRISPDSRPGTPDQQPTASPLVMTPRMSSGASIVADARQRHQTIRHFGASDAWATQFVGTWPAAKRQAIADLLFSTAVDPSTGRPLGIGLTAWRFNIGAGSAEQGKASGIDDEWRRAECFLQADGTFDWGRQAGSVWFAAAAHRAGVRHITAFSNSPPVNFTKNGRAYCDRPNECNLDPRRVHDYAAFLVRVLLQLRHAGLPITAISPVNEPQWQWLAGSGQEGCHFQNADIRGVVWELGRLLAQARGPTDLKIDIPESAQLGFLLDNANQPPTLGHQLKELFGPSGLAGASPAVGRYVAAHSYGTTHPPDQLVGVRHELRRQMQRCDPSLEYWMTEYCLVENNHEVVGEGRAADDMRTALYMARVIHYDLSVANASSWSWWLAVSPYDYKDGLVYVDKEARDGAYHQSKLLWALGNFSRFLRPGAQRLNLPGYDDLDLAKATGLMVSAYIHDADQQVVVVCVNYSPTTAPLTLSFDGVRVGAFTPYITDATRNLQPNHPLAPGHPCILPAASVVTFVARVLAA